MFPLTIDDTTELRLLAEDDAPALFTLIASNRHTFDRWMRWTAAVQSEADALSMIHRFQAREREGNGYHAGIWHQNQLVGGIVCHGINRQGNKTEIGYWIDSAQTGKGIITRACRAIITHLFTHENVHRIEIQAMVENKRSRAVAERLGFTFEGIKRESEWINNAYQDHAVYSLLDREWEV